MKTRLQMFLVMLLACSSDIGFCADVNTNAAEKVTFQGGKVLLWQAGKSNILEKEVIFSGDITVKADGSYAVGAGKKRQMQNGDTLALDRTLVTASGQIIPLADHITMRGGKPILVRDGESAALTAPVRLPDGSSVMPDGTMRTASGTFTRLIDGHMVRLDGAGAITAKDTATLKEKKVLVFKDGSQFEIKPNQSLTMNDGSRVFGNGDVVMRDGKRVQLTEGDVITFQGVTVNTR